MAAGLAAFDLILREAIDITDEAGGKLPIDRYTQSTRDVDDNLYFVKPHTELRENH